MILAHHYMPSVSANIYFRWEVIIIQHPDYYFRHIEVSEKNRSYKIPIWVDGGVQVARGLASGTSGIGCIRFKHGVIRWHTSRQKIIFSHV